MKPYPNTIENEAGNVWFAEPEPPEPMTCADKVAVLALFGASAGGVVYLLVTVAEWLYPAFSM